MQLVILIYHYTGASQVLEIYMFVRILVSSYLFLNGFGHFQYFWSQAQKKKQILEAGKARNDYLFQGLVRCFMVCLNIIEN